MLLKLPANRSHAKIVDTAEKARESSVTMLKDMKREISKAALITDSRIAITINSVDLKLLAIAAVTGVFAPLFFSWFIEELLFDCDFGLKY